MALTFATDLEVVADGLAFTETPRWRDGRLWFSDIHDFRVKVLDPITGAVDEVVEVPGRPAGLGWDREGRLLVVSIEERTLFRLEADRSLVAFADLGLGGSKCNDMVVDDHGRAYVGTWGFDLAAGEAPALAVLLAVAPDGAVYLAAEDLVFPNGMAITPDRSTLVVVESLAGRLTSFDLGNDGSLSGRRVWAAPVFAMGDGMCIDVESCVWMASPMSREVLRIREGGEIVQRVTTLPDRMPVACALGGDDRRTLFVCTSTTIDGEEAAALRQSRIEAVRVDVPGGGLP